MQTLMLIRHGESEWNRAGIIQGFLDCDLSPLGREQAQQLRTRLDRESIDVAYSSTSTRALDTARISIGHRLGIREDPDLREINLGVWEGIKATELKKRLPVETTMWFTTPSKLRIEGGEILRSFRSRVTRTIDEIRGAHSDDCVAIFAHGGVICTYLTSLLGLKLDDLWRFKIHNGSITRIIFPFNGPRIDALNDVSHLNDVRHTSSPPPA